MEKRIAGEIPPKEKEPDLTEVHEGELNEIDYERNNGNLNHKNRT